MKKVTITLRIMSIRLRGKKRVIVAGYPVTNGILNGNRPIVVIIKSALVSPENIDIGELWLISGTCYKKRLEVSPGINISEWHITAESAEIVSPSGAQIINWLADNVDGIGTVKANKLWDKYGEDLYELLNNADLTALQQVINKVEIVENLLRVWQENGDSKTLQFVQKRRIPLNIARKVIKFHADKTISKLTEDPYRMLSFCASFTEVDRIARQQFGVAKEDIRRLVAALEQVLYSGFDHGHTCMPFQLVIEKAATLIGRTVLNSKLAEELLEYGHKNGVFVKSQIGEATMLHSTGAWLMEKYTADFINALATPVPQTTLFSSHMDLDLLINQFQEKERIALKNNQFTLNLAQRQAIKTSFTNRFSIITGGAGTGKTTVLKGLYYLFDAAHQIKFQMALSGRATARMVEATHVEATTIAGFIQNIRPVDMGSGPAIIIDESSMLDVMTFYKLLRKLPKGTHLILVGDPHQLPPVGAGLVFHCLCKLNLPKTELTVVKRQADDSKIPEVAGLIRQGVWPSLTKHANQDVSFISCADEEILTTVMTLYNQNPENTQILGATKANAYAGISAINEIAHDQYVGNNKSLEFINKLTGINEYTGFNQGDLILYTANDWPRDLQNGSLGKLIEIYDPPKIVNIGSDDVPKQTMALGLMCFDGRNIHMLEKDIDCMQLAYAITVHKAQGSQFNTVIIPVVKSRIMDRTFIYTAITRAQTKVIFVGDQAVARQAVQNLPKVFQRMVGLQQLLQDSQNTQSALARAS